MSVNIPTALRRLVFTRAAGHCEYRLLPQEAVGYRHEPDHIIPRQHDGQTTTDNLVLAYTRSNRYKGPNVGSFDPETGKLVPFYNPRTQTWQDHFQLDGPIIHPLTSEGRVTARFCASTTLSGLKSVSYSLRLGRISDHVYFFIPR